MMRHLNDAVPLARNVLVNLEQALETDIAPDMADCVEIAMQHMGTVLDYLSESLSTGDEEIEEIIAKLRGQADLAISYLCDLIQCGPVH
jgi:hypothetical protein